MGWLNRKPRRKLGKYENIGGAVGIALGMIMAIVLLEFTDFPRDGWFTHFGVVIGVVSVLPCLWIGRRIDNHLSTKAIGGQS